MVRSVDSKMLISNELRVKVPQYKSGGRFWGIISLLSYDMTYYRERGRGPYILAFSLVSSKRNGDSGEYRTTFLYCHWISDGTI